MFGLNLKLVADPGHDTSLGTMEKKRPCEIKIHIIISLILIKPRHKHEMSYFFETFKQKIANLLLVLKIKPGHVPRLAHE
jgi:hypothetical protein